MSWPRVEVLEVRQGASYEDVIYDQDVVVRTTSGATLTLFDMSPMIARNVMPGMRLEVVVAVSVPDSLRRDGTAVLTARNVCLDRIDWDEFRQEMLLRPFCTVTTPEGDFVIAAPELPAGCVVGERLIWGEARLDLLAWRRL
jgi:hypothetical protein